MYRILKFRPATVLMAALLAVTPALAATYYVYPAHAQFSSGRVMESRGVYYKHNVEVMYGKDAPDSKWHGFIRFDLSGLPDSLSVESAVLEYEAVSVTNPPPRSYVTHVELDPWTADGAALWSAIVNGTVVAPDMAHGRGWIERPLNSLGVAAVQAGLASDYVALGIYKWDTSNTWGHIKGYPAGRHKPRLRLELAARDIGVVRIVEPQGIYSRGDTVVPTAVVENHGEVNAPFRVSFIISTGSAELYRHHIDVPGLVPGMQLSLFFPQWLADVAGASRVARVEVDMAGDIDSDNNIMVTWFDIRSDKSEPPEPPNPPDPPDPTRPRYRWGWQEVNSVPLAASARPVRAGGWLAVNRRSGLVYAGKGNKTADFAVYNPLTGRWRDLAPIPAGEPAVMPGKGARGTSDGRNSIFMVKGNSSTQFWRYDIAGDFWERLPDLPPGPNSGPVRSGSGLVYVEQYGTGYVYLLKGPKGDLVRYNTDLREWELLASAPAGGYNKWDHGSWLVYDGAGKLYAHKARKHELWTFDLETERWDERPRTGMPLVGTHARALKVRQGSSATWRNGAIYALKGGKSQEFWRYTPADDRWFELETIPKYGSSGRVVRMGRGGDFTTYPYGAALFALKGDKSLEFWRYTFAPAEALGGERSGGAVAGNALLRPALAVSPSVARGGRALVRLSGVRPGERARVALYDPAGRLVSVRPVEREEVVGLDLDGLAAGVYLVRLETESAAAGEKLVISR